MLRQIEDWTDYIFIKRSKEQICGWAPFVLGFVIVGLEVGYIYAYKAGWQVSTAQIVQAALVAIILVFIGYGLYHESLTLKKIAGIFICLGGLVLINI